LLGEPAAKAIETSTSAHEQPSGGGGTGLAKWPVIDQG
jgi:hypothetical protein